MKERVGISMANDCIRTDLAVEIREKLEKDNQVEGVVFKQKYIHDADIKVSKVVIQNDEAQKIMGKSKGTYYTFEALNLPCNDGGFHEEVSYYVAGYLKKILSRLLKGKKPPYHILVAGLGNRSATSDSLGPKVIDNLDITQNIYVAKKEQSEVNKSKRNDKKTGDDYADDKEKTERRFAYVSGIAPGVMGQTGMETADIIGGIIEAVIPDALIVVDALAAGNAKRLANTIQITDTGIMPGSGVGNHRNAINKKNMGIPVVAIGVPMVVEASAIVADAIELFFESVVNSANEAINSATNTYQSFSKEEKKQFVEELMPDNMAKMYVTPKDIDETIKRISYTVSEAINMCMSTE